MNDEGENRASRENSSQIFTNYAARSTENAALAKSIPYLPVDKEKEPVFTEPWQAQAFAMTVSLHEKGLFTWTEWAEYLSGVIHEAGDEPTHTVSPDAASQDTYYTHWLTALERISEDKAIATKAERETRIHQWDRAARATPHGEPITLDVLKDV